MPANDLHLSVNIAAWWTTAVSSHGATVEPVIFDGQLVLPSGVFHHPETAEVTTGAAALAAGLVDPDRYHPDPMALLAHTATPTPSLLDPIVAVAAVLGHVATTASAQAGMPVTALTVVTAQPWGHRARQRLTDAAERAGLPPPHIVTAAAAAAALADEKSSDLAGQRFVAVCMTGDAAPELSILDTSSGHTQLAGGTVRDPAAAAIDDCLITLAATRAAADSDNLAALRGDWRLAREINHARTTLATQPRAPVLLPAPYPPAVLDRTDLAAAAAAHLDRLDDTVTQLLADADLDPADLTITVLVGTDATTTELHARLTKTKLTPTVTANEPYAVAYGAAKLTRPLSTQPPVTAATARLPRTRLTINNLVSVIVLAACSLALLIQTITTADIHTIADRVTDVRLPAENVSLAAAIAALTAWTAAQLAPTTWLRSPDADDDIATGILLRRAYLAAAATGLALAGLWGLGTAVGVNYPTSSYLHAALTAALPITGCATVIAFIAPRIPAPMLPGWLTQARPPVTAIAVAAAGVYLQRAAGTLTFPTNLIPAPGLTATLGAALLGGATAFTATRHLLTRIVTTIILGAGYALLTTVGTVQYLTIAYNAVLAWWAITTTITTIKDASPRITTWLSRWTSTPS